MNLAAFLTILGFAAGIRAQVSSEQLQQNIDAITELSSQNNNIAQSISITNLFSTAPQLINGLRDITVQASDYASSISQKRKRQECLNVEDLERCLEDLGQIVEDPGEILGDKRDETPVGSLAARAVHARQAAPPYTSENQQAICSSFRSFVTVNQQLLQTVIGKHGLLSLTPFTQPIGTVLRSLEGAVDALASGIIDTVPDCAQDVTQNKNNLDQTLENAVSTYND